jgi:hypothetical protein
LNAGQHLGRRAAGGAACGRRSAPRLAGPPCQHRCGTGLQNKHGCMLSPGGVCHHQQPLVAGCGCWSAGVGRALRTRPSGASGARTAGRRPSNAARTPGWVPAHPCQPQPWPSSACAASARERHGRAAAGACWCGDEGMARARAGAQRQQSNPSDACHERYLSTCPIAARERRERLRSSMPGRPTRPGRARGPAAGGRSSEPRCRAGGEQRLACGGDGVRRCKTHRNK